MPVYAKNIEHSQKAWLEHYEAVTGFEPMHQEELDSGKMSFEDVAKANIKWFEGWAEETVEELREMMQEDS